MPDRVGFWPLTSSVDFCEENYRHSLFVAEPWNVLSSATIPVMAAVALLRGNVTGERMFSLQYVALFITGFGSMMLHSTLSKVWQASDELPMLFVTMSMLYTLSEINTPLRRDRGAMTEIPGKHSLGTMPVMRDVHSFVSKLGDRLHCGSKELLFIGIAALNTYIYLSYQEVYAAFLFTYISSVLSIFIWSTKMFFFDKGASPIAAKYLARFFFVYVVVGSGIWVVDMHMCEQLAPLYRALKGATFHNVWHVAAGLGSHLATQAIVAQRAQNLGIQVEEKWHLWGTFPLLVCSSKSKRM